MLAILTAILLTGQVPVAPVFPVLGKNPYATEVEAALGDAKTVSPFVVGRTRYFTMFSIPPDQRQLYLRVLKFWVNSLSKEAEFAKLRKVSETIYAIDLGDTGWDLAVWETLAQFDPYFHVQVVVPAGQTYKAFSYKEGEVRAGWREKPALKEPVITALLAPWLPVHDTTELVALTQSGVPIVRVDWWLSMTMIQAGRDGVGYYDWLGLKDKTAFNKVIGLDVKVAQAVKKEVAGIVRRSGVGYFPRQIFVFGAATGSMYETRDALDDNKKARNALRQLDNDYKHQAEELYGFLPNGLFIFFLGDDKGVRVNSAPDTISSDDTAPGRDRRIHIGLSCVRCHVEGLRPIKDWARDIFNDQITLNVTGDEAKSRRLRQLYVGELQEKIDDDIARYTRAVKKLTGLTPEKMAKETGQAWEMYVERDLLPRDIAAEFGLSEEVYLERLRSHYAANKLGDTVLASHLKSPAIPIRQDDYEELMPLLAPIVLQVQQSP